MSSSESEAENVVKDIAEEKQQDEKTSDSVDSESENVKDIEEERQQEEKTFQDLGLDEELCQRCETLGWKKPTKIQCEAIPVALEGRDVIGLAETGSGKTGAFALPVLQALRDNPQRFFGLVLTPTRELAFQIAEQFELLGEKFGLKCAALVGGMDMVSQAVMIGKKPHIIVATPGRLVDHLENTKGFNLRQLKYLILDEADRILNLDFEKEVDKILSCLPKDNRKNMLFSATMTKKVAKLQRASLTDAVKVEVSSKYQTVDKLKQYYCFIPEKQKDVYLVHLVKEMAGNSFIIFCSTCNATMKLALMLRSLGYGAVPLNGQMSQDKRSGMLKKFKQRNRNVLIATDVASRGLDIPHVDVVINYDIPTHSKDYIHRVGRTARAGRAGKACTFVSQYDLELYLRIEQLLGRKMPKYETEEEVVMTLAESVAEAQRYATKELKEMEEKKKSNKRKKDTFDDSEHFVGVRDRIGNNKKNFDKKNGKKMKRK